MDVQHAIAINQNNTFSFKARLNRILTWASPHKIPKLYRRHFDGESWTQNGRKFWASGLQTQSLLFSYPKASYRRRRRRRRCRPPRLFRRCRTRRRASRSSDRRANRRGGRCRPPPRRRSSCPRGDVPSMKTSVQLLSEGGGGGSRNHHH